MQTDLTLVIRAAYFAGEKHRNQRRGDVEQTPYINHPLELAAILTEEGGITDVVTICAALLHDTIEDTETTVHELTEQFGKEISHIVAEVSNDMTLDSAGRKISEKACIPNLSHRAKLVKIADKLANIRDVSTMPPVGWTLKKKEDYFDFAREIVTSAQDASPELYKIFIRDYDMLALS